MRLLRASYLARYLPWLCWGPVARLRSAVSAGRWGLRRRNVGYGSYIEPGVQIFGFEQVFVGSHSTISEDTLLNASRRPTGRDKIVIGNNCHIGRRNYFSTGGLISIGDYGFTGVDCHFLGCGHEFKSPWKPYISTGLTAGAPIVIETNCWLTTSVTVHEGVTIGRGSVIGARSTVLEDIPPFSVAVGNPCKVVKRYDFRCNAWIDIGRWSAELEELVPDEASYLETLRASHPELGKSLHAASRRFGSLR